MSSEPTLSITFIRHGESTDNLRPVWAGWEDAPLSNHGMNQARALGAALAGTRFAAVLASDLQRAASTAGAVHAAQAAAAPAPPLAHSPLLREQHFGVAEGKPWSADAPTGALAHEELWAQGVYPVLAHRHERFPGGESLDDLRARAERAVEELVMPHVLKAAREGRKGQHVAVVSHGLCISELVPALLRRGAGQAGAGERYSGLKNTAWTRVAVEVKGAKEGESLEFPDDAPPPFHMRVSDFNHHEHLVTVVRQKGGIGGSAHDPKQSDLRAFFAGGGVSSGVEVLDHARSNVDDHPVADQ